MFYGSDQIGRGSSNQRVSRKRTTKDYNGDMSRHNDVCHCNQCQSQRHQQRSRSTQEADVYSQSDRETRKREEYNEGYVSALNGNSMSKRRSSHFTEGYRDGRSEEYIKGYRCREDGAEVEQPTRFYMAGYRERQKDEEEEKEAEQVARKEAERRAWTRKQTTKSTGDSSRMEWRKPAVEYDKQINEDLLYEKKGLDKWFEDQQYEGP